jgi:hypothetical protein
MKRGMIATALLVALATPAFANEYQCSPYGTGCVPIGSQPSVIDQPTVYVPPQHVWPRSSCDIDGPNAWDCGKRKRERKDNRR